ncbi:MAG: hypothetical protein GY835_21170 [bacterium]|nr:hypothetical protein [bacterium]
MSRTQELKRILSLAMQDSNWHDALNVLNKLVKQEENQPAYHNQIGDILLKTGKQAEAIVSFLTGVEIYNELGMFPNGAALCKKILRFEPGHREATWWLGEMKTRQGFLADGAERMLEALHYYAEDPMITKDILVHRLGTAESLQPSNKSILEFVATTYAQAGEGVHAREVTLRVADIEEREGNTDKAETLRQLADGFCPSIPESAEDQSPGISPPAAEIAAVPPVIEPESAQEVPSMETAETVASAPNPQESTLTDEPDAPKAINDRKQNEDDLLRTLVGSDSVGDGENLEIITTNMGAPDDSVTQTGHEKIFDLGQSDENIEIGDSAGEDTEVSDTQSEIEVIDTALQEDVDEQVEPAIALQEAMDALSAEDGDADMLDMTVQGFQIQSASDLLEVPDEAETETASSEAPSEEDEVSPDLGKLGTLDQFMSNKEEVLSVELTTTIGEAMQTDNIEEVLAEFRNKMAHQMGEMSAEEHYQLGVSYMEMELFSEAVEEFRFTLDHPMLSIKSREWMARCYLSLNMPWDLIELLGDYLNNESYPRKSLVELYYLIGQAYQSVDRPDKAVDSFTKVYSLDTEFRDVKARLEILTCRE